MNPLYIESLLRETDDVVASATEKEKARSELDKSYSRILTESESWRHWLTRRNWLLVALYSLVYVWVGYTEMVLAPLISTFEDQCNADSTHVSILIIGSSLGFVISSLLSGAIHKQLENGHLLHATALFLGSVPLVLMKCTNNIWLIALLWAVANGGCGVLEPGIAAYSFEMTVDSDGDSDAVFGAMLLQCLYFIFGLGASIAPLSLQFSEHFTGSYIGALVATAVFGLTLSVALALTKPPNNKMEVSLPTEIRNTPMRHPTIDYKSVQAKNDEYETQGSALFLQSAELSTSNEWKCNWKKVAAALVCQLTFSMGAIQVAANAFIGDYTHRHLGMNRSMGRYLNTAFFASQMAGRMLWMYPMHNWPVTVNLTASTLTMLFAAATFMAHMLLTSNGDHSWMLYVVFAVFGLSTAPTVCLQIQFIDTVVGNSPLWSALVMTNFWVGSTVTSFALGFGIHHFGYYVFPYIAVAVSLFAISLLVCVLFLARTCL